MTNPLTERDYQQISAYLDGQLSVEEQREFESRLQGQPDLRVALYDLRRTRTVMRNTPAIRRTRNFMLTPEMVKARSKPRSYPFFQVVFAAASVLFAMVFTGDLVQSSLSRAISASAPAAEVFEAAPAGETLSRGAADTDASGDESAGGATDSAAAEPALEMEEAMDDSAEDVATDGASEETANDAGSAADSASDEGGADSASAPTQAAIAEESLDEAAEEGVEVESAEAVDDQADAQEEAPGDVPESESELEEAAETAPEDDTSRVIDIDPIEDDVKSADTSPGRSINWFMVGLRGLEVILLLTVLTSGAALLYLRRR